MSNLFIDVSLSLSLFLFLSLPFCLSPSNLYTYKGHDVRNEAPTVALFAGKEKMHA